MPQAPPKETPKTIESSRVSDETVISPGEDIIQTDEFSANFRNSVIPQVLITSSDRPSLKTNLLMKELQKCIPNSDIKLRKGADIKKFLPLASRRGYTVVVVIHEDRKIPNGLLVVNLPEGPSAYFRLTSFKRGYDIRVSFNFLWII